MEEDETSDGESSSEIAPSQKLRQKPRRSQAKKQCRKRGVSSDDDSGGIRPARRSKVYGEKNRINYRDISSDEEVISYVKLFLLKSNGINKFTNLPWNSI